MKGLYLRCLKSYAYASDDVVNKFGMMLCRYFVMKLWSKRFGQVRAVFNTDWVTDSKGPNDLMCTSNSIITK